jgi:peptide/nickel transport system permease protein
MSAEMKLTASPVIHVDPASRSRGRLLIGRIVTSPPLFAGGAIMLAVVLLATLAPLLFTTDPIEINPGARMQPISAAAWFGTDMFGRDVYSRIIYGSRTSLMVGFGVALLATTTGAAIGLVTGYVRLLDAVLMRVMDGLMAIPGILLAIAMVAVTGASLTTVITAITVPEIPRVVRLVRSIVLSVREEPYVEAAIAAGTRLIPLLWRHILPSMIAPLTVLASYVCSSAILAEAILSFLGAGLPAEVPSWGNMIAEGRTYFQIRPDLVFLPGIFLALTVLGINVLGDGLRDELDPRTRRRF